MFFFFFCVCLHTHKLHRCDIILWEPSELATLLLVPVSQLFIPRVGSQMEFVRIDFTFLKLSFNKHQRRRLWSHISSCGYFPLHRRTVSFVNIMKLWLCHCGSRKFCKTDILFKTLIFLYMWTSIHSYNTVTSSEECMLRILCFLTTLEVLRKLKCITWPLVQLWVCYSWSGR